MIAPTTYDRVQYTLSYLGEESLTIKEVRNWKEDEKEFARVREYDGIFTRFSNDLEFVKDGRDYINFLYETYGINADIRIVKEERHPQTDIWEQVYFGYLDLSTMSDDGVVLKVKVVSGGVEEVLKNRESERIEIDRVDTLDGSDLPPLETITVGMEGRNIFLLSEMENSVEEIIQHNSFFTSPTLKKIVSSDERIVTTYKNLDDTYFVGRNTGDETKSFPQKQQFFYYENDRTKYLKLTFDIDIAVNFNLTGNSQVIAIKIQKSKIGDDPLTPDPLELYDIIYLTGNGLQGFQNITYTNRPHPFVFELKEDECLAVVWAMNISVAGRRNSIIINKHNLTIEEDSFFESTQCKMIKARDLGKRLSHIITGKDAFYSEALTNGEERLTAFAHGFWIREFEKDEDDANNRFKPFTTSWRDFAEAMRVTWDLSVGIDYVGFRERIRMEPKKFFYNPNVTIRLPKIVQNIKRSVANEHFYSGIEVGYEKGGEYEESMGLDEYNGRSSFVTAIKKVRNIFEIVSPFRTDSYGAEFARRKTKRYYPTEDTRYDNDIFQFDIKYITFTIFGVTHTIPLLRKWQDDFQEAPENVYSPETAYNLRYSPSNLIFRHGWNIASALIKYPSDLIRYGSSNANSKLKTKLLSGQEVSENSDIVNSELGRALFKPEWVEFQHPVNFDIMKQVQGQSEILGEKVPNFYGLVEYRVNESDVERGWLFNLRPNGAGDWKILRANI